MIGAGNTIDTNGNAATIAGVIAGTGYSFTKTGAGTLFLTGNNSFSGPLTISGGAINAAIFAGTNANSSIGRGGTIAFAGDLVLDGGLLQYTGTAAASTIRQYTLTTNGGGFDASGTSTGALTFSGAMTASGTTGSQTFTLTGTGNGTSAGTLSGTINNGSGTNVTAIAKTGTGTWTLSAANTFTGNTIVSAGVLALGNSLALQNSTLDSSGAGTLTTSNTTLTIGGLVGGTDLASVITTGYSSVTGITLNPVASVTDTYSGAIANGAMTLTKSGLGTQALSGTNTYTGATTIQAGSLVAGANAPSGSAGAFGNAASALVLGNASTGASDVPALLINGAFTVSRAITVGSLANAAAYNATIGGSNTTGTSTYNGNITLNTTATNYTTTLQAASGGTVDFVTGTWATNNKAIAIGSSGNTGTVQLDNAISTTGGLSVNFGTLQVGTANVISNTTPINVNGGTFAIGAVNDSVGAVTLASGSITGSTGVLTGSSFTVQSGSVSAILAGSGVALNKTTGGTVTLTGANTYTGATTVTTGTLLVNGNSAAATGALSVSSGATLGGNGTIGGNTTINGTLAPGNSPGLLTFAGSLTLNGTTALQVTGLTRGSQYDAVDVGSLLAYGGVLTVDFSSTFSTGNTFNFFDFASYSGTPSSIAFTGSYTGNLTETSSGVWTGNVGGQNFQFLNSSGVLSAVPEPATWALLAFSLTTVMVLRRRRS